MPQFTFSEDTVLVAGSDPAEFAIGATGVFRVMAGGEIVPIFDLNGSAILAVAVGPLGVHEPFKADIPHGVLDFGSAQLSKVSDESIAAVVTMGEALEAVQSQIATLHTSKAGIEHEHLAADITDLTAAVQAIPGLGGGIGGAGIIDGGTATSTFSDIYVDGGDAFGGGGLGFVSDL